MQEEKKPMTRESYQKKTEASALLYEKVQKDPLRLRYHLQPPMGWLNDPNGLCQIGDTYHIYFQYTPFNPEGGTGLWGHMTTKDFIRYEEQEPAIYPDSPWDANGAYSGSAFAEDGMYYFFYTGNVKYEDQEYDYITDGREQNVILTASRDGFHFSEKKLIMTNQDFPDDMSRHVRDPQVMKRDGKYYMLLGARDLADRGSALLYESEDLEQWKYKLRFTTEETFGYMWECPNLVETGRDCFLVVCPQGVDQRGMDFANRYQCGYFPLEYQSGEDSYRLGRFRQLDRGFDFYAPQVFTDRKDRRILIGWMGMPDSDYGNGPTVENGWQHALTVPRELYVLPDGRLAQRPVEELKQLRGNRRQLEFDGGFCESVPVCFEMDVRFDTQDAFCLVVRESVKLEYGQGIVSLSMGASGCGRIRREVMVDRLKNIKIMSDSSSLEIFMNDGEEVFTTRIYDSMCNLRCEMMNGGGRGSLEWYELKHG